MKDICMGSGPFGFGQRKSPWNLIVIILSMTLDHDTARLPATIICRFKALTGTDGLGLVLSI